MRSTTPISAFLVAGLALSFIVSLILFNTVSWHNTYDTHVDKKSDIFRVSVTTQSDGQLKKHPALPAGLLYNLESPDAVDKVGRVLTETSRLYTRLGEQMFIVRKSLYADPAAVSLLLPNDGYTQQIKPSQIIVTQELAERMFGHTKVEGQVIHVDKKGDFEIARVVEDQTHSHLSFDMILPLSESDNWDSFKTATDLDRAYYAFYVLKPSHVPPSALQNQVEQTLRSALKTTDITQVLLTPLKQVHLTYGDIGEENPMIDQSNIRMLSLAAIFVLVVALANYTVFSFSAYRRKLKSYAIRNILGASKQHFVWSFVRYNLSHMGVAWLQSLGLLYSLPRSLLTRLGLGERMSLISLQALWLAVIVLGFCLLHGLLLGRTAHRQVSVSRRPSSLLAESGKNRLGQVFTALQLTLSLGFILFAFTTIRQFQFQKNHDLGYDPSNVMILQKPLLANSDSIRYKVERFKQEMSRMPQVKYMANSTAIPGSALQWKTYQAHGFESSARTMVSAAVIEADYIDLYGFDVVAGEKLYAHLSKDNTAQNVLLNEQAVRQLGLGTPEEAIGKRLYLFSNRVGNTVKGVIRDFNQESLKENIQPVAYMLNPVIGRYFSLKLADGVSYASVLPQIESVWKEAFPGAELHYSFLEDQLQAQYASEKLQSDLTLDAGLVSLLISLIGLVGVLNQLILQKTKALNIKKILGASRKALFGFVSREIALLFALAILIGLTVAYYASEQWLEAYAYRITLSPTHFLLPIGILATLLFGYVSARVFQVICKNPVAFLKDER